MKFKRLSDTDRLDLAECQLRMVHERTGRITEGHVRRAAGSWAETNRQYDFLKVNLMELVDA